MTLRRKITWLVTLLLITLLVTNMILVRRDFTRAQAESLDQRMQTIATTVGLIILPALVVSGGNIDDRISEVMTVLRKTVESQNDIAEISIYDREGRSLLSYPPARPAGSSESEIVLHQPMRLMKNGMTYGTVKVVFDIRPYREAQMSVFRRMILTFAIFSLVGLMAAWGLARAMTRPLEILRDAAVSFGTKNYGTRARVESRDEVGLLAGTFNEMAARIQHQIGVILKLQEWGRVVTAELERERVITTAVEAFREMGGVSKLSLMLWNEGAECLEIVGGLGLQPEAAQFMKLKLGEGVAGKVLETGKPVKVNSLSRSADYKSFTGASREKDALLALPLIAKGRCFGVVNLHAKEDGTDFDDSDESILLTLAEISSVAFENSRLYDLAITDGLTKLYIARYFHQRLEEEITRTRRTAMPLSLLMADIDHFKDVNDTYGHQVGDAVLVQLARVARRVFREVDIACRYGGEEFVFILPNTDASGSRIVAERFRNAVEDHRFATSAGEIRITVSLGISTYALGRSKDEMIHEADEALYASKRGGRNRVTHFAGLS